MISFRHRHSAFFFGNQWVIDDSLGIGCGRGSEIVGVA